MCPGGVNFLANKVGARGDQHGRLNTVWDGSGSRRRPRLVYIIHDFTIKAGLKDNLIAAGDHFKNLPSARTRVEFPDPKAADQGEIWTSIVRPKLDEAAHVIAYVDKPNANVGFEIGYALGRGNRDDAVPLTKVALALHGNTMPGWLQKPPFVGFNAVQFKDEDALIGTIERFAGFSLEKAPRPGSGLLFLCPESGGKYLMPRAKSANGAPSAVLAGRSRTCLTSSRTSAPSSG